MPRDDLWDAPDAEERADWDKEARDRKLNKGTENQVHYPYPRKNPMKKITPKEVESMQKEGVLRSGHYATPQMAEVINQLHMLKVGEYLLVEKGEGITEGRVRHLNRKFIAEKEKIRIRVIAFMDESAWVITRLE